ncbi:MAG: hypothetical protein JWM11_7876 [Planctomycetaceae bacterium]|nr:hypothetical protein [Planctomycetaceae bacterium]
MSAHLTALIAAQILKLRYGQQHVKQVALDRGPTGLCHEGLCTLIFV